MPVRRNEIVMLNVAFRRSPSELLELNIISVKATVVLNLRTVEGTNSPYIQSLPINAAGKTLQGRLRHLANIAVVVVGALYGLNKVEFRLPRARRHFCRSDARPLQSLICPRD